MEIQCSMCQKKFSQKKNLYAHLRNLHKREPQLKTQAELQCEACKKRFSFQSSLSRHIRNFHEPENDHYSRVTLKKQSRLICSYEKCDIRFPSYIQLRKHLNDEHNITLEFEELTFGSVQEFGCWKAKMQRKTLSMYSLDTAIKTLCNKSTKRYYNCHRSYSYKSKGKNERALKSLGSNKIGRACPSRLEVTICNNNGGLVVATKFWKTHCGHAAEIERVTLDKQTRAEMAGKLKNGVKFDHILGRIDDAELPDDVPNTNMEITNSEIADLFQIKQTSLDNEVSNSDRIMNKVELILGLSGAASISDEDAMSIEEKMDSIIDILNRSKATHLQDVDIRQKVDNQVGLYCEKKNYMKKASQKLSLQEDEEKKQAKLVGNVSVKEKTGEPARLYSVKMKSSIEKSSIYGEHDIVGGLGSRSNQSINIHSGFDHEV